MRRRGWPALLAIVSIIGESASFQKRQSWSKAGAVEFKGHEFVSRFLLPFSTHHQFEIISEGSPYSRVNGRNLLVKPRNSAKTSIPLSVY
jgi:hypothetical protein